jgi:hypothetical protein
MYTKRAPAVNASTSTCVYLRVNLASTHGPWASTLTTEVNLQLASTCVDLPVDATMCGRRQLRQPRRRSRRRPGRRPAALYGLRLRRLGTRVTRVSIEGISSIKQRVDREGGVVAQ